MASIPYDRICVADMCRQMGISRRLYYTYFPDKESCLVSLVDRMVRNSIDETYFQFSNLDINKRTIHYLSYWKEHSDFLDILFRQNMKALFIERSYLYFKEEGIVIDLLSTPEVEADDSILWLFTAVQFTALMQWHESGYQLPVEKMAVKYQRMLKSPLLQDTI